MSLKHNPFDQTPKGNLVKRRKVFESPSPPLSVSNVEISQPERSQQPGNNVARTVVERSHGTNNVEISQPERSQQPGNNVARTVVERSQQPGNNVAMEKGPFHLFNGDPTLLVGVQRKIFEHLFYLTQQFASLTTPRLTLESMSAATGLTEWQIHSATKHLRKKGCIRISNRKDGRGGWIEYAVSQIAFDTWLKLESVNKRSQNGGVSQPERSQQPGYKPGNEPSSSSSSLYINKTTTTGDDVDNSSDNVAGEWAVLDITPLAQFGFTQTHLSQISQQQKLQPQVVQDSIYAFSFDLRVNGKGSQISKPLNYFMGILRKGIPYAPPENYKTPQEEGMEKYLQAKVRLENQRQERESQLIDLEYQEWLRGLSEESRLQVVPESQFMKVGSPGYEAMLKQQFRDKVWPKQREQILQGEKRMVENDQLSVDK